MAAGVILANIAQVEALLEATPGQVYVRWSRGPRKDRRMGGHSRDWTNGNAHAGLSASPLRWTDGRRAYLAAQLIEYRHLRLKDDAIHGWLCTGRQVGTDSDGAASIMIGKVLGTIGPALESEINAHLVEERHTFQSRVSYHKTWCGEPADHSNN